MVVVRFRGCCFLGSCSPLGKDPLVVKLSPLHVGEWRGLFGADGLLWLSCLHCVGLQHLGSGRGFLSRALGCFRFHASLVVLRVLPGVGAGSEARGEAQVTIVFLCCDLLGSGTASPTVGAKQAAV